MRQDHQDKVPADVEPLFATVLALVLRVYRYLEHQNKHLDQTATADLHHEFALADTLVLVVVNPGYRVTYLFCFLIKLLLELAEAGQLGLILLRENIFLEIP